MSDDEVPAKGSPVLRTAISAVGLGLGVFVLAALSTAFTRGTSHIAAVWPANAIVVAALLRSPGSYRWPMLAAAFVGNVLANLSGGDPLPAAFGVSFADGVEELMCVVLLHRTCGPKPDLTSVAHLLRFGWIAGFLAPLASGLLALPAFVRPGQSLGSSLWSWFAADSLGLLIVVPAAMAFNPDGLRRHLGQVGFKKVAWPVFALAAVLAAANIHGIYPLQYLLLPALLFLAVRLGASAAAIAQLTVAAVVVVMTSAGLGGMDFGDTMLERLRTVQAFLAMQSLVVLPASAVLQDRLRFEAELRQAEQARRAAEEAARETQNQLTRVARVTSVGVFASSIAHEINQPIAAVALSGQSGLRWLSAEQPKLDEAKAAFQRIVRDAHRASDIIARIRGLLSKETGPRELVDVPALLRETLQLTQTEQQRAGVAVHAGLDAILPPVLADRVQLQQVMINLIGNALDAMRTVDDRDRVLTVTCAPADDGGLCVSVADTGVGFTPEIADKVFDHLFTTKADGIGLGLAISRSIIEAHGGQIAASPNAPFGAVFRFSLPATPSP